MILNKMILNNHRPDQHRSTRLRFCSSKVSIFQWHTAQEKIFVTGAIATSLHITVTGKFSHIEDRWKLDQNLKHFMVSRIFLNVSCSFHVLMTCSLSFWYVHSYSFPFSWYFVSVFMVFVLVPLWMSKTGPFAHTCQAEDPKTERLVLGLLFVSVVAICCYLFFSCDLTTWLTFV